MVARARDMAADKTYVLEHLPECVASLNLPQHSTSVIRDALKVDKGSNSGRVLRITAWKRLCPLTDLVGDELWKAFWECYRCESSLFRLLSILPSGQCLTFLILGHFHLFKSGIRHSDISDTNLMYDPSTRKGVLNDFDLALDVRNPTRSVGHHPTGTMPFLSLDLFCPSGELDDGVQRQYYHDEESFRWVLAWIVNCYRNGKFDLPVDNPFWKWDCPKSTWFHRTSFLLLVTKEEELQRLKALPEPDQSIQISVAIMIEQIK